MDVVVKLLQADHRLGANKYTDLWVSCEGTVFGLHRVVMEAHAEYFTASLSFFSERGNAMAHPLELNDFPGGSECFGIIVEYCYSENSAEFVIDAKHLLMCAQAADRLLMPSLLTYLKQQMGMLDLQGRMEIIANIGAMEDLSMTEELQEVFTVVLERFCTIDLLRICEEQMFDLFRRFKGRMHALMSIVLHHLVEKANFCSKRMSKTCIDPPEIQAIISIRQLLNQIYLFYLTEAQDQYASKHLYMKSKEDAEFKEPTSLGPSLEICPGLEKEEMFAEVVLRELEALQNGSLFSKYSTNFTPEALLCKFVPVFVGDVTERRVLKQQALTMLLDYTAKVTAHPEVLKSMGRACDPADVCAFYVKSLLAAESRKDFEILKTQALSYLETTSGTETESRHSGDLQQSVCWLLKMVARAEENQQERVCELALKLGPVYVHELLKEHQRYIYNVPIPALVSLCRASPSQLQNEWLDCIEHASERMKSVQLFYQYPHTFRISRGLIEQLVSSRGTYISPLLQLEVYNDYAMHVPVQVLIDFRSFGLVNSSQKPEEGMSTSDDAEGSARGDSGTEVDEEMRGNSIEDTSSIRERITEFITALSECETQPDHLYHGQYLSGHQTDEEENIIEQDCWKSTGRLQLTPVDIEQLQSVLDAAGEFVSSDETSIAQFPGMGLFLRIHANMMQSYQREQLKNLVVEVSILGKQIIIDPEVAVYRPHILRLASGGLNCCPAPPLKQLWLGKANLCCVQELQSQISSGADFHNMTRVVEATGPLAAMQSNMNSDRPLEIHFKLRSVKRQLFSVLTPEGESRYKKSGEICIQGFWTKFSSSGGIVTPTLPAFYPHESLVRSANAFVLEIKESPGFYRDLGVFVKFVSVDTSQEWMLFRCSVVTVKAFVSAYNSWRTILQLDPQADEEYREYLSSRMCQCSAFGKHSVIWRRDLKNWLIEGEDLKLRIEFHVST